jgi:TctA family transporter
MEEGLKIEGVKAKVNLRGSSRTLVQLPRYWVAAAARQHGRRLDGDHARGADRGLLHELRAAQALLQAPRIFGKGEPEGVIAPETADHGAGTAAMLPMLALGIPGSATAAVMMGGLMIWGLNPGPMLFIERPDFVWGLIASMYLGNVVAVILVLATVPFFAAILRIPFAIIGPIIVVVCFIGAWTVGASKPDLWLALIFGVIGYVFKKLDYPVAPLVLALVLGDKAEDAFRQSMLMSQGSLSIFVANPLVATITLLAVGLVTWPLWAMLIGSGEGNAQAALPAVGENA